MKRYFFDLRDGDELTPDDEGVELSTMEAVQEEAARSLADMARDASWRPHNGAGHRMAIEVRRHRTGVTSQIHVPDRTAQALRRPL
jgi:hypothetical protein